MPRLGSTSKERNPTPLLISTNDLLMGIHITRRVIYADPSIRHRHALPIMITTVFWITSMSIVLCLPELNVQRSTLVNSYTLNYVPAAGRIVLTYSPRFWSTRGSSHDIVDISTICRSAPFLLHVLLAVVIHE